MPRCGPEGPRWVTCLHRKASTLPDLLAPFRAHKLSKSSVIASRSRALLQCYRCVSMLCPIEYLIELAYSMVVLPTPSCFGKSWQSLGKSCLVSYHLISLADVQRNELTISTLCSGKILDLQIDLAE